MSTPESNEARKRITMERTFAASVAAVWELWTTKDGIEPWWGPDSFRVELRSIDLRVGGELRYAMVAAEADKMEFMKKAGMPTVTEARVRYTEVAPLSRLAYVAHTDFVPGVTPYDVATQVDLHVEGAKVRMVLSFDPMHDAHWTKMASMGWESQLGRLEKLLATRGDRP